MPVDEVLPLLIEAARQQSCVVLEAPPGAGKTTRVPSALAEVVRGRVVVVEPRRVAARAAAARVAEETDCCLGETVGYQVRLERRVSPSTRVAFVTSGVLLNWMQRDPVLEGIGAVVFDEFHERSLECDLLLALSLHLRRLVRPDLVLCVLSATLDGTPVAEHLGAVHLRSAGRQFPVAIEYQKRLEERPVSQRVARAAQRALARLDSEGRTAGAVLCFLPGLGEIRRTRELISQNSSVPVFELYGAATLDRQQAALRGPARRVILATNVAESSVTVEGVGAVVDCGLHRIARFDPGRGLDRLRIEAISRASADQRAGRAGRVAPGLCLRLWTVAQQAVRTPHASPEIERVDLAGATLRCLALGERPQDLPWLEAPSEARLKAALQLLEGLGATSAGSITELGEELAKLPLPPRLARLLAGCAARGEPRLGALAAALLSERDLLDRRHSAHFDALAALRCDLEDRMQRLARGGHGARERQIGRTSAALEGSARALDLAMIAGSHPGQDFEEVLGRALVEAFPDRVARRVGGGDSTAESGRARMVGGQGLTPGATRVRDSELFVALEVQAGTGDARVHLASAIEEAWLPEDAVRTGLETEFDESTGRVLAWQRRRYLDLILAQTAQAPVDHAVVGEKLLAAALMDRQCLELFEQGSAACFVARARCLAQWRPELDLPPFDDTLRQQTLAAAVLGKSSLAEVRRSEILELLRGSWRHDQLELLDRLAPERLSLPSGHSVAVQYEFGRPPVLAARIQDLFGWDEAPKLAGGRVALLLHLLAPNGRPQQITDDLSGFWRGSYAEVRRQLAGRYPKHAWPLEPWSASAGRPRR